jgi:hypothetical protein
MSLKDFGKRYVASMLQRHCSAKHAGIDAVPRAAKWHAAFPRTQRAPRCARRVSRHVCHRPVQHSAPWHVLCTGGLGLVLVGLACPSAVQAISLADTTNAYDYIIIKGDYLSTADVALIPPLHPTLRTCIVTWGQVHTAFPSDPIRDFLWYAYTRWRRAPQYVLIVGDDEHVPVHLAYNPFYEWHDLGSYFVDDGYFVTSHVAGQCKPIMHIGRIPARWDSHISNFRLKLTAYQALAAPTWQRRILMLVGDARVNELPGAPPNAIYRTLGDSLRMTEFGAWPPGDITTVYAADYSGQSGDARTQLVRGLWDSGYGFVDAIGNTSDLDWLVFMAYFNLPCYGTGDGAPTFTESLSETGRTPVVFANTCFTNWFNQFAGACSGQDCIGSDLLMTAASKGAVAVVGPTHQADMVETYALNRTFLHELVSHGTTNIGRLLSTAKGRFLSGAWGHAEFANQFMLLGDPAMEIGLGALPSLTEYVSGGEIEDAPILQDSVAVKVGDMDQDNLRIVNEAAGVAPLTGERMLQVRVHDGLGATGAVEWIVQDLSLAITQNMIMSFWVNVQGSPGGNGKIVMDGNTSSGRLRDRLDVFTQDGVPLDAKQRLPVGPGWKFCYADLSPLRGATLQDVRVRYESTSVSDSGSLVAYFDDIRVERYESAESQELVNHSFEEDEDGDGTPDFWTDLTGVATTPGAQRSGTFAVDGKYSLVVQDVYDNGGGARQIFTANTEAWAYTISLACYAPDATSLKVRVWDLETGTVVLEMPVSVSSSWQTVSNSFSNPYCGLRPALFSLELLPQDPSRPVYVDNVQMYPPIVVGVDNPQGSAAWGRPQLVAVYPNPAKMGADGRIDFELPRAASVEFGVFDVAGRSLATLPPRMYDPGSRWVKFDAAALGLGAKPGLCFVRMNVDGDWVVGTQKVVILP